MIDNDKATDSSGLAAKSLVEWTTGAIYIAMFFMPLGHSVLAM